jgi:acyl carrier protein
MENSESDQVILGVVRSVAREKNPEVESVRGDQTLVEDLGLRSLDLARIIAKLEMKLGVDPFAELVSVTSVRTVGDLCAAYAQCFAEDVEEEEDEPQEESPKPAPRAAGGLQAQQDLRKKARKGP